MLDYRMIVALALAVMSLASCHKINSAFGMQDDNPIEQEIELEIEEKTGIHCDLTPEERVS